MAFPRKSVATFGMTLVAGSLLSGCATEDYVDEQIAVVSGRIGALEGRVQQVDQSAQQAYAAAQAAAASAQQAHQRVDAVEQQLARKRPRN
jgi:outer membrane murein-binding lipoprotein Lpp